MRKAGIVVGETIYALCKNAKPGISTRELGEIAATVIGDYGAESAFLNYKPYGAGSGFPGVVCISINEEVVHGIPGKRELASGDIVSFDVGVKLEDYCGDAAGTVAVGEIDRETERLLQVTRDCLENGIDKARSGNRISDIGRSVQVTAESAGFGVVRDLVGHGIGRTVHEDPQVPNFVTRGFSPLIRNGLTIAIEPMITQGTYEVVEGRDGWTISTADGKLAAHYEHSIAVTEEGPIILTLRENGKPGFEVN